MAATQSFPAPGSNLSYSVELSISCSNLKNLDQFSKSDPAVFLYLRGREVNWVKVGRTEVIENSLNPKVRGRSWVDNVCLYGRLVGREIVWVEVGKLLRGEGRATPN